MMHTITRTIDSMADLLAAQLDMGGFKIINLGHATLPSDAVNLEDVQNTIGITLNYWLEASNVMQTVYVGTPAFVTQTPTQEAEEELTNIYWLSSVAQTPAPFVVKNGTEFFVHFKAKVTTTVGKKDAKLRAKLYYVDADGTSNLTQIGATTSDSILALTGTAVLQELYGLVASEVSVPAGKRLKVKVFSVCSGGAANYPEINVEYGDVHDHLSLPAAGSVLGNYLPLAGGTMTGSIIMPDAGTIGLGAGKGLIQFNDEGTDDIQFLNCNVGIGCTPSARNNTTLQILDGVGFPAAQVASSDVNTLDDYEEGTYEPTLTGATSGTYTCSTNKTFSYTKIGNTVHVWGEIRVTSSSSPVGDIRISLPFTCKNNTQLSGRSWSKVYLFNHAATLPCVMAFVDEATAYFNLVNINDDGTQATLTGADIGNAWWLGVDLTYSTA